MTAKNSLLRTEVFRYIQDARVKTTRYTYRSPIGSQRCALDCSGGDLSLFRFGKKALCVGLYRIGMIIASLCLAAPQRDRTP
jgi:hypothetical protein